MAEMKLGYGSEYQLLRYLGHHREYLNNEICKIIGEGSIVWKDYPIDLSRDSRDGEWKEIECFQELPKYAQIKKEWKKYWPQKGNTHNWDGVFLHDNTWYFVEAEAHLEEANQKCGAISEKSIKN